MWTVYMHISPSNKRYIGITSRTPEKRWGHNGNNYRKTGHHKYFVAAIDKYGWDNFKHEIILTDRSESEAKYAEKYLIAWYKTHDGCYNLTDGGDGTCGFSKKPWNKGIPCTDATKIKISKANSGKMGFWKGKTLSEETRNKISKTRLEKGIKTNPEWSKKRVNVYKDAVLVNTFDSIKMIADFLQVSSSYVCDCLKKNRLCKKYKLEYA